MKSGLVTKLYLTVEPVVFGKGLNLFNEELNLNLNFVSAKEIGEGTILLEYSVASLGR